MREWLSLYDSKSGERGIYNGVSAMKQVERMNTDEQERRQPREDFGTNPALRSFLEAENFATSQKSLFVDGTLLNHYARKLNLRLSLGHSNPLLPTSSTSQRSGNETAMKNDFLEFPSQE